LPSLQHFLEILRIFLQLTSINFTTDGDDYILFHFEEDET